MFPYDILFSYHLDVRVWLILQADFFFADVSLTVSFFPIWCTCTRIVITYVVFLYVCNDLLCYIP